MRVILNPEGRLQFEVEKVGPCYVAAPWDPTPNPCNLARLRAALSAWITLLIRLTNVLSASSPPRSGGRPGAVRAKKFNFSNWSCAAVSELRTHSSRH